MRRFKNIVALLCITLMFGEALNVNAEEKVKVVTYNENTVELNETTGLMEAQELPQNVGESIKIGEDENGVLWVTLIDESQSMARSSTITSYKNYLFQYEDIWGNKKDAFKVNLECDWVKAGLESYIIILRGSAQALGTGYSCEWSDSSYTECNCWLELDVTKSGVTHIYRFIASVFPMEGVDDLEFGYLAF